MGALGWFLTGFIVGILASVGGLSLVIWGYDSGHKDAKRER